MAFLTLSNIPKKYRQNLGSPIKRGSNTLVFCSPDDRAKVIIFGVDPFKYYCMERWGLIEEAEKLPISIGNRANTATFLLWRVTMPYLLTFKDVYQSFNKVHTSYIEEVERAKRLFSLSVFGYWRALAVREQFPILYKLADAALTWGADEVKPDLKLNNTLVWRGEMLPLDMAVYLPLFQSILFRGVTVK